MIRKSKVPGSARVNTSYTLTIRGITQEPLQTLGSAKINLLGEKTEFHVLPESFAIPSDGILGTDFFEQHNTTIDYGNKSVRCNTITIPFFKQEIIECKARTAMPFRVVITNPEKGSGYVPPIRYCDGVYAGIAIVTNGQGKEHLEFFNTTESDIDSCRMWSQWTLKYTIRTNRLTKV